MPYSIADDLLIGNIPLPSYIDPEKYISAAADEIDAVVGQMYVTPIAVQTSQATRPTTLILKKANNFLASGRIILAMDSAGQNSKLHEYGRYLVGEAESILRAIMDGTISLVGAVPAGKAEGGTAPTISNTDETSIVDEFYDNFNRRYPPWDRRTVRFGRPEGDV